MKTIKQWLITVAVLLCSATASAYDFEVDGIYYKVLSFSDLTVEVTYGDNKYSGEVIIPSTVSYKSKTLTVRSIGINAFKYCTGLTSVTIPNSVRIIESDAFNSCSGLTSVTIPNSVRIIESDAFQYCTGLTSVEIGKNVTEIRTGAFYECTSLKDLRIEDGETTLWLGRNSYDEGLFYNCPLESLYLGRNINYRTEYDYGYSPFYKKTTLTSVTIGSSVTSIGERAFYYCSGLESIEIPNSVTSIGGYAFSYCSGLESIEIPNSVTSIGDYAFYNCKGLASVTIPNSVTSIGDYAFSACDSLASIRLLGETPPTVGSNNFTNKQYVNMIVYVPKGTLATYQVADTWKNFWDIQEFDVTAIENVEDVTPAFEITSSGIQFTAADGKAIAIYAPNGALVEKIDNYAGEEIALDKGVYIVRVGNNTMKVKL